MRITTKYIKEKYDIDKEAILVKKTRQIGSLNFDFMFNETPIQEVLETIQDEIDINKYPKEAYVTSYFYSCGESEFSVDIDEMVKEKETETIDRLKESERQRIKQGTL